MKINIFVPGKKFENFYSQAIKEYEKRLSRFCKVKLIFFKSDSDLSNKVPTQSYKIYISPRGQRITSEDLAKKINTLGVTGKSNLSIIVCKAYENADEVLSMSNFDMTNGLLTTIIYEQIYRAYKIMNNETYHK